MMRNHELLLSLLQEMSNDVSGRLTISMTYGMDEQKQQRRHHVELLVDAGHAEWTGERHSIARITSAGYDFLNAATNPKTGDKVKAKFVKLFNDGVPYVKAAQSAIDFVIQGMRA